MYYLPRLRNGKPAPLPWQVRLFYLTSNWPLCDEANWLEHFVHKFGLIFALFSLTIVLESEFNFIANNFNNLALVLETLSTLLVSFESSFRIFDMAYKCNAFKKVIKQFYAEIYIELTPDNKSFYDELQRKSRPTRIFSYTYFTALFTMFATPIIGVFSKQQFFPYRMHPHYDFHPWPIYVITLLTALWDGFLVVIQGSAEANLLALLIINLNGRYVLLQNDLYELYSQSISKTIKESSELIVSRFRSGLVKILKRNVKLNHFAHQMQKHYSFRIFIVMSSSALLLCLLCFEVATVGMNTKIITYITWMCTKIIELVVFGELGSTIIETTNRMSTVYYLSNWEQVIQDSGNAQQNVEIMKLITIAMELNKNPIYFTGSDFFRVSLPTVVSILQGAGSYFTCLYALY